MALKKIYSLLLGFILLFPLMSYAITNEVYIKCSWDDVVTYSKYERLSGEKIPKSAIYKLKNQHLYTQDNFDLGEVGDGDILYTKYTYNVGDSMRVLEEIAINRKTSEIVRKMFIADDRGKVYNKINGIGTCTPTTNKRAF